MRVLFSLLLLGVAFGFLGGCGWTVTPPPVPREPGDVYISKYGKHTRVALQLDQTRLVEYGFGDWRYYAEGEKGIWRGAVAITTPTEAALGRRILAHTADPVEFVRRSGADRSERIVVERDRVERLVSELDARYRANIDTEIHPEDTAFSFVKDDAPYHLAYNSNHQAADWLRQLGCEVGGNAVLSNFRVVRRGRRNP